MKLKIVQAGHPVLRQQARELTMEETLSPAVQQLIELMKETMWDAPGVGLAAPQIGESLQLAVLQDREEYLYGFSAEQLAARERAPTPLQVIINPKITLLETTTAEFHEGCLSVAGLAGVVPRALEVKVECLNEHAEPVTIHARGWHARILQHEIDHLHGTLCIDRMQLQTLTTHENYARYWREG
jgi:peptide deformylase